MSFFFTQTPISRDLHQQCVLGISSHFKEMKCSGAHLSETSPQTIRATFQSRQSNIEAAQISFLVQCCFRYCRKRPDVKLMFVTKEFKANL